MVNPIIIDLVFLAVLIAAFFVGRARGIIKMVWSLAAWIITLVLALTLAAPFGSLAENSSYADSARARLEQSIENKLLNEVKYEKYSPEHFADYAGIPKIFIPDNIPNLNGNYTEATEKAVAEIAQSIAEYAVRILSKSAGFIILILLIRIALAVLYRILNLASRLPVINGANRLLGGLLGLAAAMFAIYLTLAFVGVFLAGEWGLLMERTYLVKYFYNNNLLLQFMR